MTTNLFGNGLIVLAFVSFAGIGADCPTPNLMRLKYFMCSKRETLERIEKCNFELPEIIRTAYSRCNEIIEMNGDFDTDILCNDDCVAFTKVYECKKAARKLISPKSFTQKDRDKIYRVMECVTGKKYTGQMEQRKKPVYTDKAA